MSHPKNTLKPSLEEGSPLASGTIKLLKSEVANIGGIISNINLRYDKKGNQWAILTLETLSGVIQIYVFHNTYLEFLDLLFEDNKIFIKGKVSNSSDINQVTQIIANKSINIF